MLKRVSLQLFTSLLLCFLSPGLKAGVTEGAFLKTDDGVIVYPTISPNGSAMAVSLQMVTGNIIRVSASPTNTFADRNNLVVNYLSVLIARHILAGQNIKLPFFKCIANEYDVFIF